MEEIKQRFAQVNWIFSDLLNPYKSRNIGITKAEGSVLAFLDAKCRPSQHWLQSAMDRLIPGEVMILAGAYNVLPPSKKLKDQVYGLLYLNNYKNVEKRYGVTTGNLFVPKTVFDQIGNFNEGGISGSDIEWSRRALNHDYGIIYASDVCVEYSGQSFEELSKSIKKYMGGVAAQTTSFLSHCLSIVRYFLPMRPDNFKEALYYRQLHRLPMLDKWYLWFLVWQMKCKMAFAYSINLLK